MVTFRGLTEPEAYGGEGFESESVAQNIQFTLLIQNKLEFRSGGKDLRAFLWQRRLRLSWRFLRQGSLFEIS